MAARRKNKIGKPFSIIFLIISIAFIGLLFYCNMIPIKYLLPITIVLGLFDFVLFCLLRKKRFRPKVFVTSFISILIQGLIGYYLLVTVGFLNRIMAYDYKTHIYDVIVLKDSNYEKLKDLKDEKIGCLIEKNKENEKAIKKLENKLDFNKKENDNIDELFEDLFSNNIDAIFVEDSKYNILIEEDPTLLETTKIIDTITVRSKLQANKNDKINVLKEPFNIYITGNDQYGKITNTGRSDVNMVATVNVKEGKVLFTSIPRDYYVDLADKNAKDKLTHAGIYGVDSSIKTIENLLDTKINYYLKINFTSVEDIVDILGGVTIDSDYDFYSIEGYHFTKGTNKLDGKLALAYVRERYAFNGIGGDRIRGEHQIQVIRELIKKATNPKILTKYQSILSSVEKKFTTDFSEKNISKLVKNQLNKKTKWKVESYNLEGTDGRGLTYSYPSKSLYVMIPNEDSIKEAREKIKEYLNEK